MNNEILSFLQNYKSFHKGRVVEIYMDVSTQSYQVVRIIVQIDDNTKKQVVFLEHLCEALPEKNEEIILLERGDEKNIFLINSMCLCCNPKNLKTLSLAKTALFFLYSKLLASMFKIKNILLALPILFCFIYFELKALSIFVFILIVFFVIYRIIGTFIFTILRFNFIKFYASNEFLFFKKHHKNDSEKITGRVVSVDISTCVLDKTPWSSALDVPGFLRMFFSAFILPGKFYKIRIKLINNLKRQISLCLDAQDIKTLPQINSDIECQIEDVVFGVHMIKSFKHINQPESFNDKFFVSSAKEIKDPFTPFSLKTTQPEVGTQIRSGAIWDIYVAQNSNSGSLLSGLLYNSLIQICHGMVIKNAEISFNKTFFPMLSIDSYDNCYKTIWEFEQKLQESNKFLGIFKGKSKSITVLRNNPIDFQGVVVNRNSRWIEKSVAEVKQSMQSNSNKVEYKVRYYNYKDCYETLLVAGSFGDSQNETKDAVFIWKDFLPININKGQKIKATVTKSHYFNKYDVYDVQKIEMLDTKYLPEERNIVFENSSGFSAFKGSKKDFLKKQKNHEINTYKGRVSSFKWANIKSNNRLEEFSKEFSRFGLRRHILLNTPYLFPNQSGYSERLYHETSALLMDIVTNEGKISCIYVPTPIFGEACSSPALPMSIFSNEDLVVTGYWHYDIFYIYIVENLTTKSISTSIPGYVLEKSNLTSNVEVEGRLIGDPEILKLADFSFSWNEPESSRHYFNNVPFILSYIETKYFTKPILWRICDNGGRIIPIVMIQEGLLFELKNGKPSNPHIAQLSEGSLVSIVGSLCNGVIWCKEFSLN